MEKIEVRNDIKPQHQRFILSYIRHCNQTQAAIEAGYSEKRARSTGSLIVRYRNVREEIARIVRVEFGDYLDTLSHKALTRIDELLDSNDADIVVKAVNALSKFIAQTRVMISIPEDLITANVPKEVRKEIEIAVSKVE